MLVHRRYPRTLALACTTAALAVAPSGALAQPAVDPVVNPDAAEQPSTQVVREVRAGGDTTLALILSGSALLVAAGGAGLAGRDHRRIGQSRIGHVA